MSTSLDKNVTTLKELYSFEINTDFKIRFLTFKGTRCALFFFSSIVDETAIYESIIAPLLSSTKEAQIQSIVTIGVVEESEDLKKVITEINSGKTILFIDGQRSAYIFGTEKFQHRAIEKSENENVIKGPKESFTESMKANISLVRKRIKNENLVFEMLPIGERAKLHVGVFYINNLTNPELVDRVRKRISSINIDSVRNIEMLEQYIEESPYSIIPTILYSERPDRAAAFIEDGYVVLIMENSSACLIMPVTFWSFFHSPEDHYLRFIYGNFSRAIRGVAFFISMFISATYVAITNYHHAMIPPDLLLAIASAREKVPFPVAFEVIIMEFAFELIREAGLRIPTPLGPTIGIVGALILGQAAVEANIISPIIVIIAALSGLSSFAIADINFNYTVRISRFILILAASFYGIFGLSMAFMVWVMYLISIRSFGVPFLAPLVPKFLSSRDTIFRRILQNEKWRPSYLKQLDLRKKN